MEYVPEDDDVCKCDHFASEHHFHSIVQSYTDCEICNCEEFDIDLKATDSNAQAEEATWD